MAATYQAAIDREPSQSSRLPLLEVQELSGGVPRRVRAGVPTSFSNELFDGKILLFVRDPSIPQASSGPGRRLWEVQMQGRFLRPVDNFFMGMELSDSPKWSFVFRSMSGAMLSFVKTFEPDVHTSFGVSKGNQTELPHLVTPQFKGVDAIVETVDGMGEPPPLGSDLLSAPKGPKSERPQVPRLDATYTMAVFSTFIDLFAWKIKSIPMVGNLDMSSYFRDAGLRIVTYAVPGARDARGSRERAHLEGEKQYILKVQMDPPHLRSIICGSRTGTPTQEHARSDGCGSSRTSSPVAGLAISTISALGVGRRRRSRKPRSQRASSGGSSSLRSSSTVEGLGGSGPSSGAGSRRSSPAVPISPASLPSDFGGVGYSGFGDSGSSGLYTGAVTTTHSDTPASHERHAEQDAWAAPPLFRHTIDPPCDPAKERADEEAAQQRLLIWMAGSPTPPKAVTKAQRTLRSMHSPSESAHSAPRELSAASPRRSWSAKLLPFRLGRGAGSSRAGGRGKKPSRAPSKGGPLFSIVEGLPDM